MGAERILIVKLGAIGDVVHTLSALAALRRAKPEAYLAWAVARGGSAKLLQGNPDLDELIELDLRGWRKNLAKRETLNEIAAAAKRLRKSGFDLSFDFQGLFKSAMIPWIARIPRRIGFERKSLREPESGILLTEQVAADDRDHIIRKNLQLIRSAGCESTGPYEFPIRLENSDEQFARERLAQAGGSFAIINPGGGWPTKLWNAEGFAEIANRLFEARGIVSYVTYGPGEERLAQTIVEKTQPGAAATLDSTLKQFFALAREAKLFIGGDTGPMHLAAAAGTPIVALFGPTSAERNGPFSEADLVIERFDLDCRVDCYRRSCSHTSCMKIPVEAVWEGVEQRLRIADCGLRIGGRELPVVSINYGGFGLNMHQIKETLPADHADKTDKC